MRRWTDLAPARRLPETGTEAYGLRLPQIVGTAFSNARSCTTTCIACVSITFFSSLLRPAGRRRSTRLLARRQGSTRIRVVRLGSDRRVSSCKGRRRSGSRCKFFAPTAYSRGPRDSGGNRRSGEEDETADNHLRRPPEIDVSGQQEKAHGRNSNHSNGSGNAAKGAVSLTATCL